jgi:hypothetical protein
MHMPSDPLSAPHATCAVLLACMACHAAAVAAQLAHNSWDHSRQAGTTNSAAQPAGTTPSMLCSVLHAPPKAQGRQDKQQAPQHHTPSGNLLYMHMAPALAHPSHLGCETQLPALLHHLVAATEAKPSPPRHGCPTQPAECQGDNHHHVCLLAACQPTTRTPHTTHRSAAHTPNVMLLPAAWGKLRTDQCKQFMHACQDHHTAACPFLDDASTFAPLLVDALLLNSSPPLLQHSAVSKLPALPQHVSGGSCNTLAARPPAASCHTPKTAAALQQAAALLS